MRMSTEVDPDRVEEASVTVSVTRTTELLLITAGNIAVDMLTEWILSAVCCTDFLNFRELPWDFMPRSIFPCCGSFSSILEPPGVQYTTLQQPQSLVPL